MKAHRNNLIRTMVAVLLTVTTSMVSWTSADEPKSKNVLDALFKAIGASDDVQRDTQFAATHRQTGIIKVVPGNNRQGRALKSFCLSADGNLLAAVEAGEQGEICVFSPDGERTETWTVPIRPEAINLEQDGTVLVAGGGELLRLDDSGAVLLRVSAPHVAAFQGQRDAIRQQVIQQMKSQVANMTRSLDSMEKNIERMLSQKLSRPQQQEFRLLQSAVEESEAKDKIDRTALVNQMLRLRKRLISTLLLHAELQFSDAERQQVSALRQQRKSMLAYLKDRGSAEPTQDQIEKAIESSIRYKSRISSISSAGPDVFVVTGAAKGYGFDVWRLGTDFAGGQQIVKGLRGCCGQMDVQCNEHGVFVAENSRHRVSHYDRDGKLLNNWGKRAREGVAGFGSCCNPMNVAFGGDGSVYTAEASTGRIKRYSPEGELQQLVGSVDLVPGCKKVSIAVDDARQRVYMLDITRNHIVVMEQRTEAAADVSETTDDTVSTN